MRNSLNGLLSDMDLAVAVCFLALAFGLLLVVIWLLVESQYYR